jgi:hypothetical protein
LLSSDTARNDPSTENDRSVTDETSHSANPETYWAFAEVIGVNCSGTGVAERANRSGVGVFDWVGVYVGVNVLVSVGVEVEEGVIVIVGDLLIVGDTLSAFGSDC